jgi:sucrose-6-phosphate hydrolase SacC (GH32 family)
MLSILLCVLLANAGCRDQEDSLAAHWTFDDGSGEMLTEKVSGQTRHIHYVFNRENQPLLYKEASDPLWRSAGVSKGALLFDGYSTYIEDADFKMPRDEFTVSVWVAPRAYEWGDQGYLSAIVSQGKKEKNQGIVFGIYRHGTWSLQLGLGDELLSDWVSIWDNGHPLPKFEWSHIAATYNAKEGKAALYLNGEKINEQVFKNHVGKPVNPSDEPLSIGKYNHNVKIAGVFDVNMFNGLMDDLRIYKKALTAEEIRKTYEAVLKEHNGTIPGIDYDQIKIDPELYAGDRYRPQYHAIPPGHWMNEPHAPLYYNGKYHLFYQHNPFGPFWHQIHWGHWVSDDMVHWEHVKEAIAPEAGDLAPDGIWSGGASVDRDGNPVLFITAGNDSDKPNQRVAIYRPVDLDDPYLTEWTPLYPEPVIEQQQDQGDFGEFRDPFVWKDEDENRWYLIIGSGTNNNNGGTALLYTSEDLEHWEYHGNFFESDAGKYPFLGEHWELPVLLPVKSEDGKVKKEIFMISPHGAGADVEVYYWLGRFDKQSMRFIPEHEEPRLMDYGDGFFTGPSGFVDPKTGRTVVFTIAQGKGRNSWEDYYSGWAHTAGFPVSLYLDNETGELRFAPIDELKNAREKTMLELENSTLHEANKKLKVLGGDLLEIDLEIENLGAAQFGIQVRKDPDGIEYTSIYYDAKDRQLKLDRLNSSIDQAGLGVRGAPLQLDDGRISLKILLDRSLLEIYANDEVSLTSRIFPSMKTSMGLELFADGEIVVHKLNVYRMKSIYSETTTEPYYGNVE